MNGNDFLALLGRTSSDPSVKAMLASCGIKKEPKLKRGDLDTDLENKKAGIEIGFRDERFLDVKTKKYDEGALVFWNVTLYDSDDHHGRFQGDLPLGLTFEVDRKTAQAKLGKKPDWESATGARWDFDGYCLFLRFGKKGKKIQDLALQLPVG